MSWMFIGAVVVLIAMLVLLVVLPWLKQRPEQENLTQANIAVVKERLKELQREVDEGLLSEQDMRQACMRLILNAQVPSCATVTLTMHCVHDA